MSFHTPPILPSLSSHANNNNSSSSSHPLTPQQKSQQARNKPLTSQTPKFANPQTETYESARERYEAARVLESVELLVWYAGARNESLSQTRQHFQNIVAGIPSSPSDTVWVEEYQVPEHKRVKTSSSKDGNVKSSGRSGGPSGREAGGSKIASPRATRAGRESAGGNEG